MAAGRRRREGESGTVVPGFEREKNGRVEWVPGYVRTKPKPRWSKEAIIAAIQRWYELYEEVPTTVDWNPAMARMRGEPHRQARYLGGTWPAAATVARRFGTWSAAIREAGLEPKLAGPTQGIAFSRSKLSRRDLSRLRASETGKLARVGPADLARGIRAVTAAEKSGEVELLQDALLELAAIAVAWSDRADR